MATKLNIVIDQGTDYLQLASAKYSNGEAINLTGYTYESQLRKHHTSNTYYVMTVTTHNANAGIVTFSMSRTLTANVPDGRYLYDVEGTSSANTRTRLFQGIATITPEITK